MASVAFQLIDEITAHAQSDSLEDARERCADGTYFPNNLRNNLHFFDGDVPQAVKLFVLGVVLRYFLCIRNPGWGCPQKRCLK